MIKRLLKINYEALDIKPTDATKCTKKQLYSHLVSWAILAPSSHNTQPWKFIIKPKKNIIDICLDKSQILPNSDKHERQAFISIGCAAENLILAARYYGVAPSVKYIGEKYPLPTIRIHLNEEEATPPKEKTKSNIFLGAMKTRMMNRSKYDALRPIPSILLKQFKETASSFGAKLDLVSDIKMRSAIAELQYTADKSAVADGDFRKELGAFLLPNNTPNGRSMPGNTFGLSEKMTVKLSSALQEEGSFDPDLAYGFAASERDGIRSSPLVCILSVAKDKAEWWLKTGRALEKMALLAEIQKVNIAVHAALIEKEMFTDLLKLRLQGTQRPAALFRVGYATEKRPHSPRIPAARVIEYEN